MHSIHYYSMGATHLQNISSVYGAERAIQVCSSLIDLARCEFDLSPFPDVSLISTKPKSATRPTICLDEWNVWDPERAPGNKGAEEHYTLSDALAVGIWLNVFIRNCRELGMATIAQSVNVIAPLMTSPGGVWRQTTYFPLQLFARYMHGKSIAVHVRSPTHNTCGEKTMPEWVGSTCVIPKLDVSAAVSEDGWVSLVVVNTDEEKNHEVKLDGVHVPEGQDPEVYIVGGEGFQATDQNNEGDERIAIQKGKWDGKGDIFTFQRLSLTMIRWKP
jgi:alpha-N-arabinofuranosidase